MSKTRFSNLYALSSRAEGRFKIHFCTILLGAFSVFCILCKIVGGVFGVANASVATMTHFCLGMMHLGQGGQVEDSLQSMMMVLVMVAVMVMGKVLTLEAMMVKMMIMTMLTHF